MSISRYGTAVRLARIGTVIALAAMAAGCAVLPSYETDSGGTATSVAPSPDVSSDGSVGRSSGQLGAPESAAPAADAAKGGNSATPVPTDKLVVVNKTLRIEVTDVDGTIGKIRALAARDGGDITNMQVSTAVDEPIYPMPVDGVKSGAEYASSVPLRAYVTLRVPTKSYAAFIADAAKLGRVLFQSESSDDVTQQHVDMQARLDNLKAEQARLRQLFAKATNVKDMLAIEQELTRVQGDIESWTQQIAYLERQAAMATVTLELTEPVAIGTPSGIDWGVKTAFTDAVRAFVNTMNGLIVLLGPVLALVVFIGAPAWLIVWLVRRRNHGKNAGAAAAKPVDLPKSDV